MAVENDGINSDTAAIKIRFTAHTYVFMGICGVGGCGFSADAAYLTALSNHIRSGRGNFNPMRLLKDGEDYFLSYAEGVGPIDENRRRFLKGLVLGVSVAAVASAIPALKFFSTPSIGGASFPKMLLVNANGNAVEASGIQVNSEIITLFSYPLSNEINFLLNLGDASNTPVEIAPYTVSVPLTGASYSFPGGVGPHKSIVSYSAICQHLGCQPPELHFYPPARMKLGMPPPSQLTQAVLTTAQKDNIPACIYCACHGSMYDPYHGGSVARSPTQRPLPAVVLEWDPATDYLYAIDEVGVPVYGHSATLSGGTLLSGNATVKATSNPFPQ